MQPAAFMLKRIGNIITYITLVSLLLLNGTAHEFVHSFAGHEDTIDCVTRSHSDHHAAFESEHHHCDFLDLAVPVFTASFFTFELHTSLQHPDYFVLAEYSCFSRELFHTTSRGPPAAC